MSCYFVFSPVHFWLAILRLIPALALQTQQVATLSINGHRLLPALRFVTNTGKAQVQTKIQSQLAVLTCTISKSVLATNRASPFLSRTGRNRQEPLQSSTVATSISTIRQPV